ncbi:uncharacterized protein PG986_010054 [Apiospora aurea]|uniref:Uncharacterized protein n=1 Tax=Apiospora aurea TaxID=335848 RepID=A0ABR1Q9S1_9PEZI
MQFPRVPTFSRKWASPELSCGSQITDTRIRLTKSVWWAHGAALEKFEKDIEPQIGAALRNVELGYADIYYRLYMIGRRPKASRPVIMVCCTDARVRNEVESSIRRSGVLTKHPEFGLGACALPLEQPTPARRLGGQADMSNTGDGADSGLTEHSPPEDTAAEDGWAPLGLKIATLDETGHHRLSTGGVVVQAGRIYYQMTVKHTSEPSKVGSDPKYTSDLEEYHFDGQSDENEDEYEGEEDWEATTRGSLTPEDPVAGPWAELSQSDSHSSSQSSGPSVPSAGPAPLYPGIRVQQPKEGSNKTRYVPAGFEPILSGAGLSSELDYV